MFSKSNILATLAGTVTLFLLGYLIWGVATTDLMEGHSIASVMKDPPDFLFILLGNLFSAFAISTIYGKWARGHHSAKEGAELGVLFGIFVGFGIWFVQYATTELMDLTGYLINAVLEIIYYAVTGIVIALVYKATSKKATV